MELFSKSYKLVLDKAALDHDRFKRTLLLFSLLFTLVVSGLILLILLGLEIITPASIMIVPVVFLFFFVFFRMIPRFKISRLKSQVESDLLYSTRHLLLKLESGSSLIISLESVAALKTQSANFFKQIVYDIALGIPIEDAIDKAIRLSPSRAYSKVLEEISNSLKTGSDIRKSIKATLEGVTREHLIQIQAYGKKLSPMSLFYMIIGTIIPSMGTAILVVISSLGLIEILIDNRILLSFAGLLLIVQLFFVLAFKSLKPSVVG